MAINPISPLIDLEYRHPNRIAEKTATFEFTLRQVKGDLALTSE